MWDFDLELFGLRYWLWKLRLRQCGVVVETETVIVSQEVERFGGYTIDKNQNDNRASVTYIFRLNQ